MQALGGPVHRLRAGVRAQRQVTLTGTLNQGQKAVQNVTRPSPQATEGSLGSLAEQDLNLGFWRWDVTPSG